MPKDKFLDVVLKEENSITIFRDSSCEMAKIKVNHRYIFEGNYWDFHPGCQGNVLPEEYGWKGVSGLADAVKDYITDKGFSANIVHDTYSW